MLRFICRVFLILVLKFTVVFGRDPVSVKPMVEKLLQKPSELIVSRGDMDSDKSASFEWFIRNIIESDLLVVDGFSSITFSLPPEGGNNAISPLHSVVSPRWPRRLLWLRSAAENEGVGSATSIKTELPLSFLRTIDLVRGHASKSYRLIIEATIEAMPFGEKELKRVKLEGVIEVTIKD